MTSEKKSLTSLTNNENKVNDSLGSNSKEGSNHGANLVRSLLKSEKYLNLVKKIFLIFMAQIVLFFMINIVSYIILETNLTQFIDYSNKMLVPDLIIISYSYLIETENLLMLKDSGYLTLDSDVLQARIIELDGHCYDHLNEFLTTMKDPSYANYFNDEMKVYYFIFQEMQVQTYKYKDFLNVLKEKVNMQIIYSHTFIPEIYDLFISNFRTIIEMSSTYMKYFLAQASDVKAQQR